MQPIRLAILGSKGRLGSTIAKLAEQDPSFCLAFTPTRDITTLPEDGIDLFIDVSAPGAVSPYLPQLIAQEIPVVCGTTGLSSNQKEELERAAEHIPIFLSPNFSYGIALLRQLAQSLPEGSYSLEETHHIHKKDQPSGTALLLAKELPSKPDITSRREGEVIGDHSITLKLPFETLTLSHSAKCREIFAFGALKAASSLYHKPKGLYTDLMTLA